MVCVAVFARAAAAAEEPAAKPIRVILVTGNDVKAHDWTKTSPQLKKILDETKKFNVTTVNLAEDPKLLENADSLKKYDLMILNYFQGNLPPISDKSKQNLLSFVRDGKGFACFHMSSGSWQDWDEWHKLVGRWWTTTAPKEQRSGHGPRGKFQAVIVSGAEPDPITKGMDSFEVDDELYAKLADSKEPIKILVLAESKWSGKIEPLVFTKSYGKGRMFHFCFGHDVPALENPSVMKIFARGCEWAATGKVDEPEAK
jgi:hypothetical protein